MAKRPNSMRHLDDAIRRACGGSMEGYIHARTVMANAIVTSITELDPPFAAYRANVDENKRLAELRNALLPKLMSGEIDVSKVSAKQFVV